ncbi:MAG: undecaprenyl-diphosphate phosphatase [Alphaproteobacteria bacterium]|nr:undecaprenyl-diphosphate phosphatase [Alphaproteobacteria bacterium]
MIPVASALGALFLGVVQGLTEFLPVSSSGHLTLFGQFFELGGDNVLFNLFLHVGTLIPVVVFYREEVRALVMAPFQGEQPLLQREGVKQWMLLVAASVPTAIIGLVFKDTFEALFDNPAALTVTFAITAVIMLATRFAPTSHRSISLGLAVVLGIVQGLAITPGISRSGSTIAAALLLGVHREEAARFSFLMSVPAISGATLLMLKDADLAAFDPTSVAVGFFAALISGYGALYTLVELVKRGNLYWFSLWCFAAAIAAGVIAYA